MKRTMPFFYALPVSLLALMLLAGGLRSNVSAAEYSGTFEGCEAMDGADQCLLVTEDAKQLFLIGNAARVSAVLQNTPNNLIDILKTSQTGRRITVYGTVNEFGELTDVTNVVFQDAPPLSGEGLDGRAKIRGRFAGCEQKMDIMDCSVAGDDGNTYFVNAPIGQASTIFTNTPKTVFDAIHPAGWNGRMVVIEGEIDAESQQFSSVYNIYLDEAAASPQTQTAQPSRGNAQSLGNLAGEPGRPGHIDAALPWGNKIVFFMGPDVTLYDKGSQAVDSGFPVPIGPDFGPRGVPGWDRDFDAAINWGNGKLYVFKGSQYMRYDIANDACDPGYPKPINNKTWPGLWTSGIDAVVNWGNGKAYFFKGGEYIRYSIADDRADPGYPKKITGKTWPGLWTSGIDAVVNWGDGRAYFFKGREYIRYSIARDQADQGFPVDVNSGIFQGLLQ